MHEFSTMSKIFETILNVARSKKADKVIEVNLEIGELTFLNPEQLKFVFSVLSDGTIASEANLHIKSIRTKIKCLSCGYMGYIGYNGPEYHLITAPISLKCAKCESAEVDLISGKECNLKNIKIIINQAP